MVRISILLWPILLALCSSAQTVTTIDPNSGQTIVEVITINPEGLPATRTLLTLSSPGSPTSPTTTPSSTSTTSSSTSTTSSTTTTSPNNPGPVGQPAPTTATPGAPTPFTYTTIINGQTVVTTDIFTPTSPPTVSVVPTVSGTVWDLSSYLSQYGTATSSGATRSTGLSNVARSLLATQFAGMLYLLFCYILDL